MSHCGGDSSVAMIQVSQCDPPQARMLDIDAVDQEKMIKKRFIRKKYEKRHILFRGSGSPQR